MTVPVILLIVACIMFFIEAFKGVVFKPNTEISFMNLGFAFVVLSWIVAAL